MILIISQFWEGLIHTNFIDMWRTATHNPVEFFFHFVEPV